jgi:uncharacterized protein YndB with AHSA1/START domain
MGKTSVVINRPVRTVFARLTDLEHAREWTRRRWARSTSTARCAKGWRVPERE